MLKAIEAIVVFTLLIFSFIAGVKYSESVKNHASWLFEAKEDEVELPDLSSETVNDAGVSIEEANPDSAAPQDNIPAEEINTNINPNEQVKPAPAVAQ